MIWIDLVEIWGRICFKFDSDLHFRHFTRCLSTLIFQEALEKLSSMETALEQLRRRMSVKWHEIEGGRHEKAGCPAGLGMLPLKASS